VVEAAFGQVYAQARGSARFGRFVQRKGALHARLAQTHLRVTKRDRAAGEGEPAVRFDGKRLPVEPRPKAFEIELKFVFRRTSK